MSDRKKRQRTTAAAATHPPRWPGWSLAISMTALCAVGILLLIPLIETISAIENGTEAPLSGLLLGTVGCFALAYGVYRRQWGVERLIGRLALAGFIGAIALILLLLTIPYGIYGVITVIIVGAPLITLLGVAYLGASAGKDRLVERGPHLPVAQIALWLGGAIVVSVIATSLLSLDRPDLYTPVVDLFCRWVATCGVGVIVARRIAPSRPFALRLAVALIAVGSIAYVSAAVSVLLSILAGDGDGTLGMPVIALLFSVIGSAFAIIAPLGAVQIVEPITSTFLVFEEYWLLGYLLFVAIAIALMIVNLALARAITRGSRRAWIAMIGIATLSIPVGVATSYVFKLGPDDYYWAESMGLVLSNGAFQLLLIVLLLRSRRDLPSAD
jgi:hypothetical protein